jgi:hypothetical protein
MAEIGNPGALAGATGAGAVMQRLSSCEALHNTARHATPAPPSPCAWRACGGSGWRTALLRWWRRWHGERALADLGPNLSAKLGRLLPQLGSDSPGKMVATVAAIMRTLDRAGLDLHDLAARLTDPPRPVQPRPAPDHGAADLLAAARRLRANALDRLTDRQADFVTTALRLLTAGRGLSPKQSQWLANLHAQHAGDKEH